MRGAAKLIIAILVAALAAAFLSREKCPGPLDSFERQACIYDHTRGFK